jgi:hypothetical protein
MFVVAADGKESRGQREFGLGQLGILDLNQGFQGQNLAGCRYPNPQDSGQG